MIFDVKIGEQAFLVWEQVFLAGDEV